LLPSASFGEVKAAYRDLVKVWHPDRFPHDPRLQHKAEEKLKELNTAYHHLQSFYARSGYRSPQPNSRESKPTESAKPTPPGPGRRPSSPQNRIREYRSVSALISDDRCKKAIAHEAWMVGRKSVERQVAAWLEQPEILLNANKFYPAENDPGWQYAKILTNFPPDYFGYVLLAALCICTRRPAKLQSVSEFQSTCTIDALLPSNLIDNGRLLQILIRSEPTRTVADVTIASHRLAFYMGVIGKESESFTKELQTQVEVFAKSAL